MPAPAAPRRSPLAGTGQIAAHASARGSLLGPPTVTSRADGSCPGRSLPVLWPRASRLGPSGLDITESYVELGAGTWLWVWCHSGRALGVLLCSNIKHSETAAVPSAPPLEGGSPHLLRSDRVRHIVVVLRSRRAAAARRLLAAVVTGRVSASTMPRSAVIASSTSACARGGRSPSPSAPPPGQRFIRSGGSDRSHRENGECLSSLWPSRQLAGIPEAKTRASRYGLASVFECDPSGLSIKEMTREKRLAELRGDRSLYRVKWTDEAPADRCFGHDGSKTLVAGLAGQCDEGLFRRAMDAQPLGQRLWVDPTINRELDPVLLSMTNPDDVRVDTLLHLPEHL